MRYFSFHLLTDVIGSSNLSTGVVAEQQLILGFVFCPMGIPGRERCKRVTLEFVPVLLLLSDMFLAGIDVLHHQ